ncbi:MAG: hypothetical protein WCI89_02775 [bacterium]
MLKKGAKVIEEPVRAVQKNSQIREVRKTFQQDGQWIERPNKTTILICLCGNRYLKTRLKQEKCLRCISRAV